MKLIIFFLFFFFLFLKITNCTCQTYENDIYPTFIKAGQDSGCGIKYIDIVPDDTLIVNSISLETSILYDMDDNDTNDFILTYFRTDPSMLGGSGSNFYITPIGSNSVCVSSFHANLADSLRYNDIIDSNKTWSYVKADLYYYRSTISHSNDTIYGYWENPHSYYIGVRIYSGGKYLYGWINASFSHIISKYAVTLPYSISIYENNLNNKIDIFPNPFSNMTTIKTNDKFINSTLEVYNIFGQQIREITNIYGQTITLNRENIPNGIYLLFIKQGNSILAKKKLVITNN